jgi:hypothetical protein
MKINLKTVALSLAFVATVATAGAQGMTDQYGNSIKFSKYSDLQGSPYFNPSWMQADVKFRNGSTVTSMVLYDQIKDYLFAKGKTEEFGQFDMPVAEFSVPAEDGTLAHFSTFPGNGKFPDEAFFQVLSDGKTKLLKRNLKSISEHKAELGSAVSTREVVDNVDYFLLVDGKVVKIKKDRKSVLQALSNSNKLMELDNYISNNSLNLKKDPDLIKLIAYYNTL